MSEPADLLRDTAVRRIAPGRYRAELPESWSFFLPSGGVLTTVALHAMQAEAGAGWRPLSSTTVFHRPVPAGTLVATVHVLRRGNVTVQLRAALGPPDDPRMEVLATFIRGRSGPDLVARAFPRELPGPEEAEPYWREPPTMPFFQQLEARLAHGRRFWEPDWPPGPARVARWFRYRQPPRVEGRLAPGALPPLIDTMPAAIFESLGSEHPRLFAPSLDLTVHYLADTERSWVLAQARGVWAREGYASAEIELWDDNETLLAFGIQTMMLRNHPGSG